MTTEPASRREPLIQIAGLRKSYVLGDVTVHALRGVDVEIAGGTFVTVVGASGSGKSTFMNIVGLLDRPSGGQYFLEGEDVSGFDRDRRAMLRNRKIGFVFQNFNLLPRTSALENVELPLLYDGHARSGEDRHRKALGLLQKFGLLEFRDKYPGQLSGGMRRRVELAQAMINNPRLMILDEPFRGLDVMTRGLMQEYYLDLFAESRMTTLFITSELEEALVMGERVLVMDGAPARIAHSIDIDLPYPRTPQVLASERYLELKRELMAALYLPA